MIKLDYSQMTHDEIIDTIIDCQRALRQRGTITIAFQVFYVKNKNIKTAYISKDKRARLEKIIKKLKECDV